MVNLGDINLIFIDPDVKPIVTTATKFQTNRDMEMVVHRKKLDIPRRTFLIFSFEKKSF